jgi:NAD/NADP transhydrogenase beta subunit
MLNIVQFQNQTTKKTWSIILGVTITAFTYAGSNLAFTYGRRIV